MAIPDYQTIMYPFLKLLKDEKEYSTKDIISKLGSIFNLTQEEKEARFSTGIQPIFNNRVGWSRTYLKKACLIDSPKRGVHKITKRGINLLNTNLERIDSKVLKQYPEFIEFVTGSEDDTITAVSTFVENNNTPEEIIDQEFSKITKNLAYEILQRILTCSPTFFEQLVVELLVKMGYGGSIKDAGRTTRYTKDEGIDGTIKEDKLGLDIIYIQAKKWQGTVGRPEIQKFVGALAGHGAKKGIFITTSDYSKDAFDYLHKNEFKIVLVNGIQLAQYMIDYNLGVSPISIYEIKRLDSDYFGED